MSDIFKATIDKRAQDRFLARYTGTNVDEVLTKAAQVGGKAASLALRDKAPIGTAKRLGQYYRRKELKHGTFRKSVTSRKIRGRRAALKGLQGRTVGVVIGPIGPNAFTRAWLEFGTVGPGKHRQQGTHWVERAAIESLEVARLGSDSVLTEYARV